MAEVGKKTDGGGYQRNASIREAKLERQDAIVGLAGAAGIRNAAGSHEKRLLARSTKSIPVAKKRTYSELRKGYGTTSMDIQKKETDKIDVERKETYSDAMEEDEEDLSEDLSEDFSEDSNWDFLEESEEESSCELVWL